MREVRGRRMKDKSPLTICLDVLGIISSLTLQGYFIYLAVCAGKTLRGIVILIAAIIFSLLRELNKER